MPLTGPAPAVLRVYGHRRFLTIIRDRSPSVDPQAVALAALGWIVDDSRRGERFLSMTGLTPDDLRQRLTDRTVLAAVLDFILGHEGDLMAAAAALELPPASFREAQEALAA